MTQREVKRIGRLMLAGYPFIVAISRTTWLLVSVLPLMTAILYDKRFMRSWVITAVMTANIIIPIGGIDVRVTVRPNRSKRPGSVVQLLVTRDKGVVSWV